MSFEHFAKTFFILDDSIRAALDNREDYVEKILRRMALLKEIPGCVLYALTRSVVLLDYHVYRCLRESRDEILHSFAIKIQALARGFVGRKLKALKIDLYQNRRFYLAKHAKLWS